jgi:hypothetical protein
MNDRSTDELAKILWNYNKLSGKITKNSDCIIVLGSHDTRVAERASQLFLDGYAPLILFSGGFGRLTDKNWTKSEAETFADVALKMGVPRDKIIIENKSTNTGENIEYSIKLLLDELKETEKSDPKFKLIQVITRDPNFQGEKRHVDGQFLKDYFKDIRNQLYFVSGPPKAVEAILASLEDEGISRERIKSEDFGGY